MGLIITETVHDLFLELDAFNPRWQKLYDTTEQAAAAAGACELWRDYCRRYQRTMTCTPHQVQDIVGMVRLERKSSQSSSLPYRLDTIGTVRQVEE